MPGEAKTQSAYRARGREPEEPKEDARQIPVGMLPRQGSRPLDFAAL
jgi:hypothetical protein